jgi:SAM-dependent methyltransferase
MHWARDFYAKQAAWTGVFPNTELLGGSARRADALESLVGSAPKRILELGCGGGYAAARLVDRGHTVVGIDLVPACVANAHRFVADGRQERLSIIEGDFYTVAVPGPFDVVCYFDGFGIGEDADQRRLLRRIAQWLAPGGCALLDVLTPWYWAARDGEAYQVRRASGQYTFDADACRMVDRMWPDTDPSQAVTQSIRCYAPADLRLLLEGTGLALVEYAPFSDERYTQPARLVEAMLYLAKLVQGDPSPAG